MNPYDPSAEQPNYKQNLLAALAGGNAQAAAGAQAAPAFKMPDAAEPGGFAGDKAAAAPAAAPALGYSPGANAGKNSGMILGYDTDKLNNTGYNTGKYNNEVRAFSNGLKQDVGVSRGGLGNMNNYLKSNGYPDAQVVGDDKIDFDGNGPLPPIDVIRGDGQIVFQDPRGVDPNAGGGAAAPSAGGGLFGGSTIAPLLQGNAQGNIQQALGSFGQANDGGFLQQLLAQLAGGGR